MKPIKIFVDSTADVSEELREQYDISLVPLYVTIGGNTYKDQVDIDTERLYELVDEFGELPKTSAPSTQDFINHFQPWIDKNYDIIFFGISSELSATIQSANLAAQEYEVGKVNIVDSKNLSMGIGLMAIRAAQWVRQGLSTDEILERAQGLVARTKTSFIIDTLKYLHMGGRCSSLEFIAGTALKIRPEIQIKDGSLVVGRKYRGKNNKVLKQYYTNCAKGLKGAEREILAIAHSAAPTKAEYLKQCIEKDFDIKEIQILQAGTVISSHCGPGTIGLLYIEKHD